jgi:DNA excision repair protein ERCC-2
MRFCLGDLEVLFPYDRMYPEQFQYMRHLKEALDAGNSKKRHCLLEMPTGTGKTVCLLSLITSYQAAHKSSVAKLIYCTRTVPEMTKCVQELKTVMQYRRSQAAKSNSNFVGVCLSSRRNMCIHPRADNETDSESVDTLCRSMTAPWVRESRNSCVPSNPSASEDGVCHFFETYQQNLATYSLPEGVYTLSDLRSVGEKNGLCPYFMTRQAVSTANVVVCNYQYLLDPKVSATIRNELPKESIVVFDEAHNIDSICIEALSVYLDKRTLKLASTNLKALKARVNKYKKADSRKLSKEYDKLVQGLAIDGGIFAEDFRQEYVQNVSRADLHVVQDSETRVVTEDAPSSNRLPPGILQEAVPPSIRRADLFLNFLCCIVDYLRRRLRTSANVQKETPQKFFQDLHMKTSLSKHPLKFAYGRLNSLLRTLEITRLNRFTPLSLVSDFVSLLASYENGFVCIIEPLGTQLGDFRDPVLQLSCLDASIAIKRVFTRFRSVVITSGTLSPLSYYPKVLGFEPAIIQSFDMSVSRKSICPMVITRGDDNNQISSAYNKRSDQSVIYNFGKLLSQMCKVVPDGIVCFFTSYSFLEQVILKWNEQGIMKCVQELKLVFVETRDIVETTLALQNYKRACDRGRGAVFLSIARGKVAEGIDFDRQYGRCVIMFGVPFQYTKSHSLESRLDFLRAEHNIHASYFLSFDALRQTSQCIGRVVRSKTDYGLVLLADARYNTKDKRDKLPSWVTKFLDPGHMNLSTASAVNISRAFLGTSSQKMSREQLKIVLMTEEDLAAIHPEQLRLVHVPGVFDWGDPVKNEMIGVHS